MLKLIFQVEKGFWSSKNIRHVKINTKLSTYLTVYDSINKLNE